MTPQEIQAIPDVQGSADSRNIPIRKVGIKGIKHPIRVRDRSGGEQSTVAEFSMYVYLPEDFKGTHMSRFVGIINEREFAFSVESFDDILEEVTERLESRAGHVEMSFPFFMEKAAPISGVKSLMDYHVTLVGEIEEHVKTVTIEVTVPVTTLCPCSKKISRYGAHSQRSHVKASVNAREFVWIEEIVETIEKEASCELWSVLKRPDEKYVTEHAYENPKFVEDLARDVAGALRRDPRIERFVVEVENFESIHNHSAFALIDSRDG